MCSFMRQNWSFQLVNSINLQKVRVRLTHTHQHIKWGDAYALFSIGLLCNLEKDLLLAEILLLFSSPHPEGCLEKMLHLKWFLPGCAKKKNCPGFVRAAAATSNLPKMNWLKILVIGGGHYEP